MSAHRNLHFAALLAVARVCALAGNSGCAGAPLPRQRLLAFVRGHRRMRRRASTSNRLRHEAIPLF
jgi:hypothetical protein